MSSKPHARRDEPGTNREPATAIPDGTRSQALYRALNEELRLLAERVDPHADFSVACECARADCYLPVVTTRELYDDVRRSPSRFLVLAGHTAQGERVVLTHGTSAVVEKIAPAVETAILLDRARTDEGEAA